MHEHKEHVKTMIVAAILVSLLTPILMDVQDLFGDDSAGALLTSDEEEEADRQLDEVLDQFEKREVSEADVERLSLKPRCVHAHA